MDRILGTARRLTARARPLSVRLAASLGQVVPIGPIAGTGCLARRDLDGEVLLLVFDERDALCRHAVDQYRQHLGCQLDGVQRLDQLCLCDVPLHASDREHRVEVDLRHTGRQRDVCNRRK